ncbi:DeoR/GlpR family DNA-binding transcription regulator [Clostridiaceae bacterium HSG29]|nr:DeoR/GlpR family DNA-binding transcription regulator [Clostridiaceae bacterium HSG29]
MLAQERYDIIMSLLNKKGTVKTSQLIKEFKVSLETVRRDLEFLEKSKKLKRVYGGAIQINPSREYKDFALREKEFNPEKVKIAKKALSFISNGQAIALDAGTTTLILAKMLKDQFEELTIVTNSLIIAENLVSSSGFDVILTGGMVSLKDYALSGIIAEQTIKNFFFDVCFISASGISLKEGITDYNLNTVQIQKKLIESSQKTIVLADNRKFSSISIVKICDFSDINTIISDDELSKDLIKQYKEHGIEIL